MDATDAYRSTRPLFSTAFTLALALGLFLPLVVRTATSLEPYPAVLFPGGVPLLRIVDGQALVYSLTAYARGPNGEFIRLNEPRLIAPLPPHYWYAVVGNEFGQSITPTKQLRIRKFRNLRMRRRVASPEARRDALAWLAKQVEKRRRRCSIVWRAQELMFDLRKGREISTTELGESTLVFD